MSYRYIAINKNSGYFRSTRCHYMVASNIHGNSSLNILPFLAHRGPFAWEQRSWGIILSTQLHLVHAVMTCRGTFYKCYFSYCHCILVYCITIARFARFLPLSSIHFPTPASLKIGSNEVVTLPPKTTNAPSPVHRLNVLGLRTYILYAMITQTDLTPKPNGNQKDPPATIPAG